MLWLFLPLIFTQPTLYPGGSTVQGTLFLDREAHVAGFFGQTFLIDNIPFIDIPDQLIQDVYYYRWTSIQRNIRYVMAGAGWMCTEFVQPVGYAKAFGTIDAAAGHHIDETRWLRSTHYADDYIELYTRGPADSVQYTQWILDAMNRRSMVTGNVEFLSAQLDDMKRMWHEWDFVFDKNVGLYYYKPVWDAQERSLPCYIADPNGTDPVLQNDGPDTFRPSHNAYMIANARAIARTADLAGNKSTEAEFDKLANVLEAAMFKHLWASEQKFFMDIIRPDNPDLTRLTGREQVGLFPYRFGIGLEESYAQPAVDAMFDSQGFMAPYGPTTLEIRDPWFMGEKPDGYCCYWNGMSWPYSTSHTLKSLAAIYRAGNTNVTTQQYYQYLWTYAKTQQNEGRPFVAESHYPFEDDWSANTANHSEHYDHSTNNDDVITGLLGILPQSDDSLIISPIVPDGWTYFAVENLPYHGHLITVIYDKDGSRYNQGSGLTVFVDGENVLNTEERYAEVSIPSAILPNLYPLVNIAANPSGPGNQYPKADATYTHAADFHYKAIDGVVYYDDVPDNRWSNIGSPNVNDTLTVTFARPRNISSVTLALLSNVGRGGSVDLPEKIEIYGSDGLLAAVGNSSELLANDRNEITFSETETDFVAVTLHRKARDVYVGVCELEVWAPPNRGPTYYAADAYLTGASTRVVRDSSTSSSSGAVVAVGPDSGAVSFPGVVSPDHGRFAMLTVGYRNGGGAAAELAVEVNHVPCANVSLAPTGGRYGTATVAVALAKDKNWVVLRWGDAKAGDAGIRIEYVKVPT
ncbi:hypothetical protein DL764_009386 [Monosporascus ibericus]|uniref:Uncharacterized protein n=1 Tax=Monosporascus ibericus TaxID=155417 RepID=A0A4Q4SV47_9PEZI|nr:hypothetical protein DL764_009386 [Monosporascus ibericus]